jgi:hypothetical protein
MQPTASSGSVVAGGRLTPRRDAAQAGRAPGLPWLAWSFALLLATAAVGLGLLNNLDLYAVLDTYLLTLVVSSLAYASVGLLIATRRPGHSLAWLFLAVGASCSLSAVTGQYATYALLAEPAPVGSCRRVGLTLVGWPPARQRSQCWPVL